MFPAQRIALLKKIVSEKKSVDIATLCSHLEVSDVTVRKYLDKLEQEGFLIKMHGGAMLATPQEPAAGEEHFDTETIENVDDKALIAEIAAAIVEDGDNLFLGSGTTCTMLAKKLYKKSNITVMTNNLSAVPYLAPYVRKLCILGGDVSCSDSNIFTAGVQAVEQLDRIYVNKAFFSADGIDMNVGVTIDDAGLANIMERVRKISQQKILMADSSKFDQRGLYRVSALDEFEVFVTTPQLPNNYKTYFFDHDIKLITSYDI